VRSLHRSQEFLLYIRGKSLQTFVGDVVGKATCPDDVTSNHEAWLRIGWARWDPVNVFIELALLRLILTLHWFIMTG
jgi:hypothetical protein